MGLVALATALFAFNGWFSAETILGGRDQGVYATHGAHIANTGNLRFDLPYERLFESENFGIAGPTSPNGYFYDVEQGDIYIQFPPTLALHLAQFFGIGSYDGLLLFNPLISSVNLLLFFALARLFLNGRWAFLAAIFFALNASQVWNARFTLSEMLAQNFVIGGLALAIAACRSLNPLGVAWGCVLASSAAFVRVDGFLMPAFITVAIIAATTYSTNPAKTRKALLPGSSASLAIGILAYGYQTLTSPGYFADFNGKAAILLLIAIVAFFYEKLLAHSNTGNRIQSVLKSPGFLKRCAVVLILLAVYGYFIRPHIEPYSQFENPHYGTRNFRENTLIDLAAYVSFPLILFALIGTCIAIINFGKNRNVDLPIILVPWLAYSLLYLYDPQISADHIWRIRRFTPLAIPGFIFFSVWGLAYLANKLSSERLRSSVFYVSFSASAMFLVFSLRPIATLREYDGSVDAIRSISRSLPKDALTVANVSSEILGPLQLAEGHKMIRGDHSARAATDINPTVERIIDEEFSAGRPLFILSEMPSNNLTFIEPIGVWSHNIPRLKGSTRAPATESHIQRRTLYLGRLVQNIQKLPASQSFFSFGATPVWNVDESGLHGQEFVGSKPFRWTDGEAEFVLKYELSRKPRSLVVDIFSTKPGGNRMQVYYNGEEVFNGYVAENERSVTVPLNSVPLKNEDNSVRIVSEKWIPAKTVAQSSDERELGVAIDGITMMFDESIMIGNALFGNRPVRGIDETGLYPTENIGNRVLRWTNGKARFSFTLQKGYTPSKLELELAGGWGDARNLEVRWNEILIFSGPLPIAKTRFSIDLTDFSFEESEVDLEIRCPTFVPSEILNSDDDRRLGLQIAEIRLSDS